MLFAPPIDISTEVFARLPERYRTERHSAFLDAQLRGRRLPALLEGPTFDRAGNLYVVDVAFGRIFLISPAGEFDLVCEYDGEPNGLALHADGRMFVADHKRGILVLDVGSGAISPLIERGRGEGFKGVNDLTFSATGDLYFTDQGQTGLHDPTGRVYRYTAAGRLELLLDTVPSPNGLVLDLEEAALYVAVTRANAVWRAPLQLDGLPSKVGVFVQLSGLGGPDGMALDAEGGLAVAHYELGTVWLFGPRGEPEYRVRSAAGFKTTNVAFGDADGRGLYITEAESGTVLKARVPRPGKRLFSHASVGPGA
ncbi:SMP-30/gluconolactonase/LRE family protein [Xanthobacter versatilis]|uniref:SMP-30/gluconolactonase/LRE family protein n=1 Tax=Xanthobacter autotrophicus (strain ATCC BAA-1158 / Py2) TaxID=78245 RepID=UPI00372B67D3